ncbi:MAG: cupin domain-containing protein [Actinocatenispora sp.]
MYPTALARLVSDPEGFLADPPTEPRVWRRTAEAVLSLADVDALFDHGSLQQQMVSVVADGQRVPHGRYTWAGRPIQPGFSTVVRGGAISRLLRDKSTVVLESLHRTWRPLGDLCRRLSYETGLPIGANAFLTPRGAQGFAHHYDTHSVLIVQTSGSKTWQLHPPVRTDPLEHQPFRAGDLSDADWERLRHGEPALEVVLRGGDVLWIPRGWIHNGFATGEHSLHVSLSFPALTPHWIATELVRRLDTRDALRAEVPWGFGRSDTLRREAIAGTVELLLDALRGLDQDEAAEPLADAYRRYFLEPARAPVDSALADPEPDDVVCLVPEAACGTSELDDGRVKVHLGDGAVILDRPAATAVTGVLESGTAHPVPVRDLVPGAAVDECVELAGELLRLGLLRRVPDGPAAESCGPAAESGGSAIGSGGPATEPNGPAA